MAERAVAAERDVRPRVMLRHGRLPDVPCTANAVPDVSRGSSGAETDGAKAESGSVPLDHRTGGVKRHRPRQRSQKAVRACRFLRRLQRRRPVAVISRGRAALPRTQLRRIRLRCARPPATVWHRIRGARHVRTSTVPQHHARSFCFDRSCIKRVGTYTGLTGAVEPER